MGSWARQIGAPVSEPALCPSLQLIGVMNLYSYYYYIILYIIKVLPLYLFK